MQWIDLATVLWEEDDFSRVKFAECLLKNDQRDFWNEVKKIRCHGNTVPVVVDSCNSPNCISNAFLCKTIFFNAFRYQGNRPG